MGQKCVEIFSSFYIKKSHVYLAVWRLVKNSYDCGEIFEMEGWVFIEVIKNDQKLRFYGV